VTRRISPHLLATDPPALTGLMARARELAAGGELINLAQAVVDYPPPMEFIEEVRRVAGDPAVHRYTPDPGLPALRAMLARHVAGRYGLDSDPESGLIVTPGANQACFSALAAVLEPGDEVIIPTPWYFNHAMTVQMLGGVVRPVPTSPGDGHLPDPAQVARAVSPRTKAVVLVNPNNPTGSRYPDQWIREMADLLAGRRIWVVADQTYQEMVYEGQRPLSIGSLPGMADWTVTAGSFSKSLSLAGWRIGFLAGPPALLEQVLKIHDSSVISAAHVTQLGLMAALPVIDEHLERVMPRLKSRRDALMESLDRFPALRAAVPGGSPFVLVHLPEGMDDAVFSSRLLEEARVAAVPAGGMGPGGASALRLSFAATGEEQLAEAGRRIGRLAGAVWDGGGER
jgi:aspartate/methionine/tyrosine aminotransferase